MTKQRMSAGLSDRLANALEMDRQRAAELQAELTAARAALAETEYARALERVRRAEAAVADASFGPTLAESVHADIRARLTGDERDALTYLRRDALLRASEVRNNWRREQGDVGEYVAEMHARINECEMAADVLRSVARVRQDYRILELSKPQPAAPQAPSWHQVEYA